MHISFLAAEKSLLLLIWLEFRRSRLLWIYGFAMLTTVGAAIFVYGVSLSGALHNATVMLAQVLRVGLVALLCTYVLSSLTRRQHSQLIHQQLALPISQHRWLLTHFLAYGTLALLSAFLWGLPVLLSTPGWHACNWLIALMCEAVLMSLAAVVFGLGSAHLTGAWLGLSLLYLFARIWPTVFMLAQNPYIPGAHDAVWAQLIHLLGWLAPRFDLFATSDWLTTLHVRKPSLWWPLSQTLVYAPLLFLVGLLDMKRKECP